MSWFHQSLKSDVDFLNFPKLTLCFRKWYKLIILKSTEASRKTPNWNVQIWLLVRSPKWFSFRLPRLTCQSPTNQKEDSLSPHRISSETSTCFVTEEQAKQNRGPPRRRETWNGKTVTKLCASLSLPPRIRSFSEQDARSSEQEARSSEQEARFSGQGARLSDDMQTHLAHQKDACASENDSTTTGMQQNRICEMAFPTAEDVQRGNFLSVPKLPVRRACSLNSLKSVESLPPVFRNQDGLMVTKSSEVDWNEEEVAPYPLPICSKQANKVYQSPDGAATNKDFLQRRHRPLRRQENLLEDTASVDAISILCKSPIKSPTLLVDFPIKRLWFSPAMFNYQRVNPINSHENHHFPIVFLWFSHG